MSDRAKEPAPSIATARLFGVLLAASLILHAAGYLLNLWHEETVFDKMAHLFTSFAVVGTLGSWLGRSGSGASLSAVQRHLFLAGILLGGIWEVFEWGIGIIGGLEDTLFDLLMDTIGAGMAVLLIRRAKSRETCR